MEARRTQRGPLRRIGTGSTEHLPYVGRCIDVRLAPLFRQPDYSGTCQLMYVNRGIA